MMKKISSIITLLFIACSIILGGGSALATDDPAIAPAEGSLTIHKYLYDADGIKPGDGKEVTGEQDLAKLKDKEIKGVQFDVYKVGDATGVNAADAPKVVPGGDGWTYTKKGDTVLEVTNGDKTYQYTISDAGVGTTGEEGLINFPVLERGYYFVVENLNASNPQIKKPKVEWANPNVVEWKDVEITAPAKPFVVAVPMTDPENLAKWITDVHVYPKNQSTEVVKEPSKPSVNVGDKFSWSIAVELPVDIKDYKKFIVTDKLDPALTYTNNSVEVYQAEKNSDGKWVKANPEKKLNSYVPAFNDVSNTLTVNMLLGIQQMVDEDWKGLIVEFDTTVNEKLEGQTVNIIGNKATVEFTNGQDEDSEKDSNDSEVNVGDVIIDKIDGKTKDELEGSEFQIARTDTEAKAGQFIKITVDGAGKITGFVYPTLENGNPNPEYVKDTAKDWIVQPHLEEPAVGFRKFEGLITHENGTDGKPIYKSYWVVETKAPKDYNLLGDPVEVDFSKSEKDGDGKLTYNLTEKIENSTGFTLPNTGGIGTMLLVIVGIVLVGLAIILNMNNKKKKA